MFTFDNYVVVVNLFLTEVFTTTVDAKELEHVVQMHKDGLHPGACAAEIANQRMKECTDD